MSQQQRKTRVIQIEVNEQEYKGKTYLKLPMWIKDVNGNKLVSGSAGDFWVQLNKLNLNNPKAPNFEVSFKPKEQRTSGKQAAQPQQDDWL